MPRPPPVPTQVSLPDDPLFDPVMGVRVRDSAALAALVPGLGGGFDPIVGVANVPLKHKMPSFARHEAARIAREVEEDECKRLEQLAEDARRALEGEQEEAEAPEAENVEMLEEFVFESAAVAKGAKGSAGAGTRTLPGPDAQDMPGDDESGSSEDSDDGGEEDESGGTQKDPIITRPLEATLKDIPFESHRLHLGANKASLTTVGKREVGLLKMQLRVLEEDGWAEALKAEPAPRLKALFREEMTKACTYDVHAHYVHALPRGDDQGVHIRCTCTLCTCSSARR